MASAATEPNATISASGRTRPDQDGTRDSGRLVVPALRVAEGWIAERRATMERKLDRLAELLGEE